jgi:hypothetical protein
MKCYDVHQTFLLEYSMEDNIEEINTCINFVFRTSTRKDEMTGKMLPVLVENHKGLRTDEFENQ